MGTVLFKVDTAYQGDILLMKRISIERYKDSDQLHYAGVIEGETDNGQRWIIFLNEEGAPEIYWPDRDPDGKVKGRPVTLWHFGGKSCGAKDNPLTYEEMYTQSYVNGETKTGVESGEAPS